jgi:hypothetical protein
VLVVAAVEGNFDIEDFRLVFVVAVVVMVADLEFEDSVAIERREMCEIDGVVVVVAAAAEVVVVALEASAVVVLVVEDTLVSFA